MKNVLILCAAVLVALTAAASSLVPIEVNGAVSNRVNVVFLAEGYTSTQQNMFLVDATNMWNGFIAKSPFREYRAYLNAYAIQVASVESGSDHPAYSVTRSTYFNSSYDALSDYLLTIPTGSQGQGRVDALLALHMPASDLAVVLVNDITTGGSDGYGRTAIVAMGVVVESSAELLAHEAGHVLANLGDEYTAPYPGYPDTEEPNTTRETRRDYIKWKAWVAPETPVPTPESADYVGTVGLFDGAHYHETGWYRPKQDCAMNSFFSPFCEICCEALVVDFYGRLRPVDTCFPAPGLIPATDGQTLSFQTTTPQNPTLSFTWRTNGVVVPGATGTGLVVSCSHLSAGSNSVALLVKDATAMVRTDPGNALTQSLTWTVLVNRVVIESPHLTAGNKFTFKVVGAAPDGVTIQATGNLSSWLPVSTNYLVNGSAWVTNSSLSSPRFYRAVIR